MLDRTTHDRTSPLGDLTELPEAPEEEALDDGVHAADRIDEVDETEEPVDEALAGEDEPPAEDADPVLANLGLVRLMARRYIGLGVDLADLEQEALLGLIVAVERFDPDKGVKLTTFARYWIRYHLQRYLRANRDVVPIPQTRAIRKVRRKLRAVTSLLQTVRGRATDALVAEELGVDEEDVALVRASLGNRDVTLDPGRRPPGSRRLREPGPETLAARAELRRSAQHHVRVGLEDLDARERRIIAERRLTDAPSSLRELGEELSISAERVRQLERRAFDKMRRGLATRGALEAAQTCARQLAT